MRRLLLPCLVLALTAVVSCSVERTDDEEPAGSDAGPADGGDAGLADAGLDAGHADGGLDTGHADAGVDAGEVADAGNSCAGEGTCTETQCDDISGNYVSCATCPYVGTQGPFATTVTRVGTGCEFRATLQQGGQERCAAACAGPAQAIATTLTYSSYSLACTGTATSAGANMTCAAAGLPLSCTYQWLPAGTTVCP